MLKRWIDISGSLSEPVKSSRAIDRIGSSRSISSRPHGSLLPNITWLDPNDERNPRAPPGYELGVMRLAVQLQPDEPFTNPTSSSPVSFFTSHAEALEDLRNKSKPIKNLMVIAFDTRKIVRLPTGEKYAALSYVWGQSTAIEEDLVNTDDSKYLRSGRPDTIEDSLLVTQQLGLRYLWIDRYCIPQDDPAEKADQIGRMHEIYGQAHVTIIAAAGDGPHYGLPGVNRRRRVKCPFVRIGSHVVRATPPSPKLLIESSKWSSHGWTFQEGLLSSRRIVFTDHQVYFQCNNMAFFEEFDHLHPCGIRLEHKEKAPLSPLFDLSSRMDIRAAPWEIIGRYCSLDLTKGSDAVNAILGILNYYQDQQLTLPSGLSRRCRQEDAQIRHIAGLPISKRLDHPATREHTWEDSIVSALFWKSTSPGKRREPQLFPSWSWAGWDVKYCYVGPRVKLSMWDIGAPHLFTQNDLLSFRSQNIFSPSVSLVRQDGEISGGHVFINAESYEELLNNKHDLSRIKYLRIKSLVIHSWIIPYEEGKVIEYPWPDSLENTEKILAFRCKGIEKPVALNLTSQDMFNGPFPPGGYPCLAVVLDDDICTEPSRLFRTTACLLVVALDKKRNCYERVGVAKVSRQELRKTKPETRTIKLG